MGSGNMLACFRRLMTSIGVVDNASSGAGACCSWTAANVLVINDLSSIQDAAAIGPVFVVVYNFVQVFNPSHRRRRQVSLLVRGYRSRCDSSAEIQLRDLRSLLV